MIGLTIDQFKVVQSMAKTPVGETFLAIHNQTGGKFVIQAIRPEWLGEPGFRQKFLEDVVRVIKFEHPNVLPPANILEHDGRLFTVREHLEGETLRDRYHHQNGVLALDQVLRIFKDIVRGIGYGHSEGFVHRFLNPESILLTRDGRVKILGFGKVLQDAAFRSLGVEARGYCARYYAPERFRNPATTDVRADIYALGAMLFEAVTGQPPYPGATFEAQAGAHFRVPVPDPRGLRPDLPEAMVRAIGVALGKHPEERFQNTNELYRALESLGAGVRSAASESQFETGSEAEERDAYFDSQQVEPFSVETHEDESLDFSFDLPSETVAPTFEKDFDLSWSAPNIDDSVAGHFDALDFSLADDTMGSGDSSLGFQALDMGSGNAPDLDLSSDFGLGSLDLGSPPARRGTEPNVVRGDFFSSDPPSRDTLETPYSKPSLDLNLEPSVGPETEDFAIPQFDPGLEVGGSQFNDFSLSEDEAGTPQMEAGTGPGFDLGAPDDDELFAAPTAPPGPPPAARPKPMATPSFAHEGDDEENPFAEFENTADKVDIDFGDDDDFAQDFASPRPAAGKPDQAARVGAGHESRSLPRGDGPPDPPLREPPANRNRAGAGLASSIANIQKDNGKAKPSVAAKVKKPKPVSVKRAKRIDFKALALTLGLAAAIVAVFFFWYTNRQKHQRQNQNLMEIRQLSEIRDYDGALARIRDLISGKVDAGFAKTLNTERERIEMEKKELAVQISELMDRAKAHEAAGDDLLFDKDDAYGSYLTILKLAPGQEEALAAEKRIREEMIQEADQRLLRGQELEALNLLAALDKPNQTNREVTKKYNDLKEKLKKERLGAIQEKTDWLIARNDFEAAVPLFEELVQIDSKTKYVKTTRDKIFAGLIAKSSELQALEDYDQARRIIELATRIDPEKQGLEKARAELKEDRLRTNIENIATALEEAIANHNFPKQFQLATKLLEMDPGNHTAGIAMEGLQRRLSQLKSEADGQMELGQFKGVAELYKEIYKINGSDHARDLWQKYERWSPPQGMAYVPPSTYRMGDVGLSITRPLHDVILSAFFIDIHEVTNAEYKAFVDAHPEWRPDRIDARFHDGSYLLHWEKGAPLAQDLDKPVCFVSWYAAEAYARAQGKRLPSEAEWERAASGGTAGQKYWWGNYSDAKMAVYEFYPSKSPAPVGSFPPNGFGIHEILGNVNEWVADFYDPQFYSTSDRAHDPVNLEKGTEKIYRGGSFRSRGKDITIAMRFFKEPRHCSAIVGFRCAKSARLE